MAYNEIILDESVLDVDSWLPEFAIDKLVESLIEYQNSFVKIGEIKNVQYFGSGIIGSKQTTSSNKFSYTTGICTNSKYKVGTGGVLVS